MARLASQVLLPSRANDGLCPDTSSLGEHTLWPCWCQHTSVYPFINNNGGINKSLSLAMSVHQFRTRCLSPDAARTINSYVARAQH